MGSLRGKFWVSLPCNQENWSLGKKNVDSYMSCVKWVENVGEYKEKFEICRCSGNWHERY